MKKPSKVSIEHLRINIAEIVSRVQYGNECFIVTKYGKDSVVVINHEEYERFRSTKKKDGS